MEEEETDVLSVLRDYSKSPNITPNSALQSLGVDLTRMDDAAYLNQLNPTQKEAVAIIGERTGTMKQQQSMDPIGQTTLPVTEMPEVPKGLQLPRAESVMAGAITGDMPKFARSYFSDMGKEQQNLQKGIGEQTKGQFAAQTFEADKNKAVAAVQEVRARNTANQVEATAAAERVRALAANESRKAIDTANKMVTNFEIDPRRFYKESYNAFGSAIAVALGQFGASLTGGPNTAFQIIDRAVSRDIAAQREQLNNLKFGVQQKVNAYTRLMDTYRDERVVESLMREQMNTAFIQQIEMVESKYQGMIDTANLEAIKGEAMQRQAKTNMEISTNLFNAGMKVWSENNRRSEALAALNARKLAKAGEEGSGFQDAGEQTKIKMMSGVTAMLLIEEIEGLYAQLEDSSEGMESFFATGWMGGNVNAMVPWDTTVDKIQKKVLELGQQLVQIKSGATARAEERELEELKLPGTRGTLEGQLDRLDKVKGNMKHQIDAVYFILSNRDQENFLKMMGPDYTAPKMPNVGTRSEAKAKKKKKEEALDAAVYEKLGINPENPAN